MKIWAFILKGIFTINNRGRTQFLILNISPVELFNSWQIRLNYTVGKEVPLFIENFKYRILYYILNCNKYKLENITNVVLDV